MQQGYCTPARAARDAHAELGLNEQMARVVSHHAMLNAKLVKSSSARLRGSAGSPSRGEKLHGCGPWVARLGKWS